MAHPGDGRWHHHTRIPTALAALAFSAVIVEVATMLLYLAAIGIITGKGPGWSDSGLLLIGYCLVMVAPALILTAGRITARRALEGPLTQLDRWLGRLGIGVLNPGDRHWPTGVDDLGDSAPFVLWTKGAASFLARPPSDLVAIIGARAATSYGEHVTAEISDGLTR